MGNYELDTHSPQMYTNPFIAISVVGRESGITSLKVSITCTTDIVASQENGTCHSLETECLVFIQTLVTEAPF